MQKLRADTIRDIAKTGTLTASMPAGSYVTIGGQQYTNTSAMSLNMGTNGAGGLDTGSIAANTTYYIYAIVVGGSMALIASASASAPTGFSPSKIVGALQTNGGSATINFIFATGQDPGEPLNATAGVQIFSEAPQIPNLSGPNLLINGGFDFWQRGTSTTATGSTPAYLAPDRWSLEQPGSGLLTWTRETDTPNSNLLYSMRILSGDATAKNSQVWQRIETNNIRPYLGSQVTFSVWVKDSTAIPVILAVYANSGGTDDVYPSAENDTLNLVSSATITPVANVWTRCSITLTLPTTSTGIVVGILTGANITVNGQTRWISGAMLTPGTSIPSRFYRAGVNIGHELSLCQRYYEKNYSIDVAPGTASQEGEYDRISHGFQVRSSQFTVRKRAQPTSFGVYSPVSGTPNVIYTDAPADVAVTVTVTPATITWQKTTNDSVGLQARWMWVASAEL
jgi:hypothetical protein